MDSSITHEGIQSTRLKLKQTILTLPNLHTIASCLLYQPSPLPPPEFCSPNLNPSSPLPNPYTNLPLHISSTPSIRKTPFKPQCTINTAPLLHPSLLFTFRNVINQQSSKLTFFDLQEDTFIPTRILFYRIEAAALMGCCYRLCMVIRKNGVEKVVVAERVGGELDVLGECEVDLEFDCVDVRYVRSEEGKQYVIVLSGWEGRQQVVLIFEWNRDKGYLLFISKKEMNFSSGRLFPILYEISSESHSGFCLLGGRIHVKGQSECHTSYQHFTLSSLFSSDSQLDSKVVELPKDISKRLKNVLFNGVVSNGYLLLPGTEVVWMVGKEEKGGEEEGVRIEDSLLRWGEEEENKHRRFLEGEIRVERRGEAILDLVHVCYDEGTGAKHVKTEVITRNVTGKSCKLI